ncbi:MAG: OadG family protein [Bacteroidaceae bacterium]|nr:OadG family protein [Bacteroidaceae bacterium]
MTPLQVNWSDVWAMTGIGIGIVFVILILLVYILQIFSKVANRSGNVAAPTQNAAKAVADKSDDDLDKIAIATALYLYSEESHDIESGILTIQHHDGNAWNPID